MTKPLTADQIAAALKLDPSVDECHELHLAIDARSAAIRARQMEIGASPDDDSVSRLVELKNESDALDVESAMLNRLGLRLNEARERAYIETAKREIPVAMKRIPAKAQKVRDALAALDAALDALRSDYAIVAEFPRIGPCPFSDDQLADLLTLRDEVWTVRHCSPPNDIPPSGRDATTTATVPPIKVPGTDPRADWPRSWPLQYRVRGDGLARVVTVRRAPQPAEPPGPPASKPNEPRGTVKRVLDVAASVLR